MHIRGASPCKHELARSQEHRAYAYDRDHCLGSHLAGVRLDAMRLDESAKNRLSKNGEQVAGPDAQECETSDTGRPSAFLAEDDGICNEAEIQNAVNDADVNVPKDAMEDVSLDRMRTLQYIPNRFLQHHGEWP